MLSFLQYITAAMVFSSFLFVGKLKIDTKLETSTTTFYLTTLFCILPSLLLTGPSLQKF